MAVSFEQFAQAFPQFIPGGTSSSSPTQSLNFPGGATGVSFSDQPGLKSELNRFGGQGIIPLLYMLEHGTLPGQTQSNVPLLGMSDQDLLAQAQQLGIDTAQFTIGANPAVSAFGQAPTPIGVNPLGEQFGQAPNVPFQFGDLSANAMLPPEVRQAVAQTFQSQRELGQQGLTEQALEASGQRGLRPSDTPIAGPLTRAQALLESQLRGGEAAALLGLSQQQRQFAEQANLNRFGALQAALGNRFGAFESALGNRANFLENALGRRAGFFEGQRQFENQFGLAQQQQQQGFLTNLRNMQEQLRQQAFQNRLQLAQQLGQGAFSLGNARLGTTGQVSSVTKPQTAFQGFSPLLTDLAQLGSGLGLGA